MFTQFGATAESLSKASTMVFRIGTDAHLYDDPDDVNIVPLLDSKFDSEKCEALKRLLALIAQGFDVSNYFPQVVKNVASQAIEVKKLVYLYLLHYAEKRPNEALLSINCFQKDLGDPNPLVRAWALRTMAGIRLHVIAPLVLVAVTKCARDPSVYVRKCAANALPKLHDLRMEENTASIEELVGILLNDNSPGVIGAAAAAFSSVCPSNLSLIGRNYRRLCETLPDVEEWGQIVLIGILMRYAIARHGLVKESIMVSFHALEYASDKEGSNTYLNCNEDSDINLRLKESSLKFTDGIFTSEIADMVSRSYLEGPDKYLSQYGHAPTGVEGLPFTSAKDNDDIKILLLCTSPLLWSHNSAVVLAAAGVHWIMAPKEDIKKIVKPLMFLLRSSTSSKYLVLRNIQVFSKAMPSLFAPHFEDFFISISDSYPVKALKLEILSSIATDMSISSIFQEFQDYIKDPDRKVAADTVVAIGLCAERFLKVANMCLEGLLAIASPESTNADLGSKDGEAIVLIQALHSIKAIIRKAPASYEKVIVRLIRKLDSIQVPAARGMIIWMAGEYNDIGPVIQKVLPVVLKYLARCFTMEDIETKLQILNSCTKVVLQSKEEELRESRKLLNYLLDLARCDLNYDIRDRARLIKELLSYHIGLHDAEESGESQPDIRNVSCVLAESIFGRQIKAAFPEPFNARFYLPGSLSQIVLHAAPGYEPLPRPCSINFEDFGQNTSQGMKVSGDGATQSELDTDDPDSVSGSLNEESNSDYSYEDSIVDSDGTDGGNTDGSLSENGSNAGLLIHLSDVGNPNEIQERCSQLDNSYSDSNILEELISGQTLESWLDEKPSSGHNLSEISDAHISSARISIGDIAGRVKHKMHTLLDPANSNGLKAGYVFLSEASTLSPMLVCLQVSFENCSTEPMSSIQVVEDNKIHDSSDQGSALTERPSLHGDVPTLVPMEEISSLDPGQTTTTMLQVHFHHHLLPLKLVLWCNSKAYPVKLRPDIGYFVKPLSLDVEAFLSKEAQLPGMFEYTRRCVFAEHIEELKKGDTAGLKDHFLVICECLALKVLSNANLFLVSVDMPVSANLDDASGLRLRFSGELLSNSFPCLVSLAIEGTCFEPLNISVKVNCEETVFGLNLLNRIVNFLSDPVR